VTRCLVYGEYPPFETPGAAATLATVRALLADGRAVEVVSPRPSAAHHHADLARLSGATTFARRIGPGVDVVASLHSGILTVGGRTATATRGVLELALRRAHSLELHLSPLPDSVDPRWVRALVRPADRVVVASPADRSTLVSLGVPSDRIVEEGADTGGRAGETGEAATAVAGGVRLPSEPWRLGDRPGREGIEAEIRRRAVRDRAAESTSTVAASWPLHLLTPLHPAPTQSTKPLFRIVKEFVHRLVAWEVVPIVEHVNHLQRAAIEAVDRAAADAQPSSSGRPRGPAASSS